LGFIHRGGAENAEKFKFSHPDEIKAKTISSRLNRRYISESAFNPDGIKATKIPLGRLGRLDRLDLQDLQDLFCPPGGEELYA